MVMVHYLGHQTGSQKMIKKRLTEGGGLH